ncbi:MAG TPA: sodium:solute symporter [Bacteroidota bacterium]|nr:sodium:solute symporter [Bacteroidota bacterium]
MGFGTLDYFIVAGYLVAITLLGVLTGGKQKSSSDYFLGGRDIPWWAACFAIVATETSTLTFISIPGLAYLTNLNFLQVTLGYLAGRIVVSFLFLPSYFRGELSTAYQFLGERFGPRVRRTASVTFMFTRVLADGVRLFATAIPLAILLRASPAWASWSQEEIYIASIVVMAGLTFAYTIVGGIRAVIWTDVVQMVIYLGAAVAAGIFLLDMIPGGWEEAARSIAPLGKMEIFRTGASGAAGGFFSDPYTLAAGLAGGMTLSMASHGTDQLIVQRLLTVKNLPGAQRALIWSGVIVMIQFAIFLFVGLLLFAYYGGASLADLGVLKADEIFPKFIIERMPSGLSGLIIAGLLAAAMSTLSGSVNSLAQVTFTDLFLPRSGGPVSPERQMSLSRRLTMVWSAVLVGVAIFFIYAGSRVLVEIALGVASFTYGGLLGLFVLGRLNRRVSGNGAIVAFFTGIAVMIVVVNSGAAGWTWFTLIGGIATIATGMLFGIFSGGGTGHNRHSEGPHAAR